MLNADLIFRFHIMCYKLIIVCQRNWPDVRNAYCPSVPACVHACVRAWSVRHLTRTWLIAMSCPSVYDLVVLSSCVFQHLFQFWTPPLILGGGLQKFITVIIVKPLLLSLLQSYFFLSVSTILLCCSVCRHKILSRKINLFKPRENQSWVT